MPRANYQSRSIEATARGRMLHRVQDTSAQALHPPPDMATLRDGGIAAH
jgi:hypothetical protein